MKVRVRAIIEHDSKLLLVQHVGYTTWNLPGGGVEEGEGLRQALARELYEELGVRAKVGRLRAVQQFREDGEYQGPEFFFEIINVADFLNVDALATTQETNEIAVVAFKNPHQTEKLRPSFLTDWKFTPELVEEFEP